MPSQEVAVPASFVLDVLAQYPQLFQRLEPNAEGGAAFVVRELLGTGHDGEVYRVIRRRDKHTLAAKFVDFRVLSARSVSNLLESIAVHLSVDHFAICPMVQQPIFVELNRDQVAVRDPLLPPDGVVLLSEYVDGTCVASFLKRMVQNRSAFKLKAAAAKKTFQLPPLNLSAVVAQESTTAVSNSATKPATATDAAAAPNPGTELSPWRHELYSLNDAEVAIIILQLALALDALHKQGILHRDVKPGNVFMYRCGLVKLGDFGMSKNVGRRRVARNVTTDCLGTPRYMAPELWKREGYGSAADVWSLGCVAYELCTLEPLFNMPQEQLFDAICSMTAEPDVVARCRLRRPLASPSLFVIIAGMLHPDPHQRWTLERVLAQPLMHQSAKLLHDVIAQAVPLANGQCDGRFVTRSHHAKLLSALKTFQTATPADDARTEAHTEDDAPNEPACSTM